MYFALTDSSKSGELILGGSTDSIQISHTEKAGYAGLWQASKGDGSTTQTLNQTLLNGNVTFDAALKIVAQISDKDGGAQYKSQIQAMAAQTPGLEYLNQLLSDPDVQWDKVALAIDNWSYDHQGLDRIGTLIIAIAIAGLTAGAGVAALGTVAAVEGAVGVTTTTLAGMTLATTTAATATTAAVTTFTALGAAINAGVTALASQAAISILNNQGDIGKTLEQIVSTDSVKNIIVAMGTAGVGTAVSGQGITAVAAQTATGCATGVISGSSCELGAAKAAVTSSAGEAYQNWVGYEANAGSGDNRFGTNLDGTLREDATYLPMENGQQRPADRGMNVTGYNKAGSIFSQGSTISRALNLVPFINATAGLHDYIFNANPDLNLNIWNVPTMLPAAPLSTLASLNNQNISWVTQTNSNSLSMKGGTSDNETSSLVLLPNTTVNIWSYLRNGK